MHMCVEGLCEHDTARQVGANCRDVFGECVQSGLKSSVLCSSGRAFRSSCTQVRCLRSINIGRRGVVRGRTVRIILILY